MMIKFKPGNDLMILIKNAEVFAPAAMGRCDILTGGGKILAIEKSIQAGVLPGAVEVINAKGLAAIPGFIDGHQHFTGGGGEGGFTPARRKCGSA